MPANVYAKKVGSYIIILVPYVDDLILIGNNSKLLNHLKIILKNKFEMTDLGFCTISLASKFCKPRKEFFFPNLSMLVNFFVAFTWKIRNQPLLPSNLESSLLPHVLLPRLMPLCTFELNLVRFDVYEDLMCDLCVTGRIRSPILHPGSSSDTSSNTPSDTRSDTPSGT
jgi:hypothetical protein